jgi:hypothetical protein
MSHNLLQTEHGMLPQVSERTGKSNVYMKMLMEPEIRILMVLSENQRLNFFATIANN